MLKKSFLTISLILTTTACSESTNSTRTICLNQEHICNQVAIKKEWPKTNVSQGFQYKWKDLQLVLPSSFQSVRQIHDSILLEYPVNTSLKITPLILLKPPHSPENHHIKYNPVPRNQFQVEFQFTLNDLPETINSSIEEASWENGLFGKILNADQNKWFYAKDGIHAYVYQHHKHHHIVIITYNKYPQYALELILKGKSVAVENIVANINTK
ncbi:hypothetical protein [Spartinivicinus ruber]|uniref:hypothetical protein n=1 Tax=Spartinivicinus ruber TaxID=2683272 RepID=UPI0013D5D7B5|nr:hypothetical protein [Spartinivicinus ruber]